MAFSIEVSSGFQEFCDFFHSLNRCMRYSVYFSTHFSCQGSHPEDDCMDRCVPTVGMCLLFQFVSCSAIWMYWPHCWCVCLRAQGENKAWKDFTKLVKLGPPSQSQSWLWEYPSSQKLLGKGNKVKGKRVIST